MQRTATYSIRLSGLIAALALGLASVSAGATVILNSGNADCTGLENSTPAVNSALQGPLCANAAMDELYKSNVEHEAGEDPDEKAFADSYDTTFNPEVDPNDALVEYVGGPFIDPSLYSDLWALAKDGNNTPGWFAWNLLEEPLTWDGMEDLSFEDLWLGIPGSISHISIFGALADGGTPPEEIPEPGMLGLLGIAVAGCALALRRRRRAI